MPPIPPLITGKASPRAVVLGAGTQLWRVHRKYRDGPAFKSVRSDPYFRGGRFDSTPDDPYSYLYAAPGEQTALLETLARGIPFNDRGERLIRRASIADYRISALKPVLDLTLISLLTTADLAAACQDEWLIYSPPSEYPQTRRWGQWLREQAAWAQGIVWPSGRDLGGRNLILFGDRCPAGVLRAAPGAAVDLDDADGARWLNKQLAPFRISVRPPRCRPTLQPS